MAYFRKIDESRHPSSNSGYYKPKTQLFDEDSNSIVEPSSNQSGGVKQSSFAQKSFANIN